MFGSLKRRWKARSKGSDTECPLVIGHEPEAELDLAYPFQAYFFLDNVRHAANQAVAAADPTVVAKPENPGGRAHAETIRIGIDLSAWSVSRSSKLLIHLLDRIVDDDPSAFRYTPTEALPDCTCARRGKPSGTSPRLRSVIRAMLRCMWSVDWRVFGCPFPTPPIWIWNGP